MNIVTGIDIVDIAEFQAQLDRGGERMVKRCFFDSERDNASIERLAGTFAAKEAVIKALSLGHSSWKKVMVKHAPDGRPIIQLLDVQCLIISSDVSITHTDSVAAAQFVAILS